MDAKAISTKIANFAAKFVNQLEKDKNVISSPLSAEFVLALVTLGTSDPAHNELLTAMGIPDDNAIRSTFTSVSTKLKSIKGITLKIANKVYIKEGPYELLPEMEKDAVNVFNAGFQKVNFGDSAAAADTINKWVEQQTNQKIKELISADSLDDLTRLVLVNALYFKGSWAEKFDASRTKDLPFHVNAATTVNVPMMNNEENFKYGESEQLNAQLLEMAYEGREASMLIVLPKEVEGLNAVLDKLAGGHDLVQEMEQMYSTKVNVTIPKFKIETEIDLKVLLPKLGINAIFTPGKSGLDKLLNNNEPLVVSKAVQKAFIEVNEEGAEAAAATVVGVRTRRSVAMPPQPKKFVGDRAALWCVLVGQRVVFAGRYQPPPPAARAPREDL